MNAPKYEVFAIDTYTIQFSSEGPNGTYKLRVIFSLIAKEVDHEVYNLGFGVYDDENETINDLVEINNGDSELILSTVAYAAIQFLFEHPNARIYAEGSTAIRTRRYQMGIAKYIGEIDEEFEVKGMALSTDEFGNPEMEWLDIYPGKNYQAFLLFKK
jgi:hypothetical protein